MTKAKGTRGGARPGAGRPSTGRAKAVFYVTPEEKQLLQLYLDGMRDKKPPIEPAMIETQFDAYFRKAAEFQSKPRPNRPTYNHNYYRAVAVGQIIGKEEKETKRLFLEQVEYLKRKQAAAFEKKAKEIAQHSTELRDTNSRVVKMPHNQEFKGIMPFGEMVKN